MENKDTKIIYIMENKFPAVCSYNNGLALSENYSTLDRMSWGNKILDNAETLEEAETIYRRYKNAKIY